MDTSRSCLVGARLSRLGCLILLILLTRAASAGTLEVFQGLDEATARIPRLQDRPYAKLWDSNGCYQCETLIFRDLETSNEVWSLSQELCTEIANIERRSAWSCDGRYISFIGNKAFATADGKPYRRTWPGFTYIADADGARKRKLSGWDGGKLATHLDKFNNWDQRRGNVLYYGGSDTLWKLTIGAGYSNRFEVLYTFPDTGVKASHIIQDVGDDNLLFIEESGGRSMDAPRNGYLVDVNRDPADPQFCRMFTLKGEGHPGSFRVGCGRPVTLVGGYEAKGLGGFGLVLDDAKGVIPDDRPRPSENYGMRRFHMAYGPPDGRVAFSGEALGQGVGLWVQLPGQPPRRVATTNDGHPTWCGHDPDWFFYACGTGDVRGRDPRYDRRLIASRADASEVRIICTPYDRRRGANEGGYDAIPRPNQSPDATKVWFHSSMLMPTNAFTGSYIAVFRRPYAPTAVSFRDGRLFWTPHTLSHEVRGYVLYRKTGEAWMAVGDPIMGTSAAIVQPGTYMVTALEWSGLESDTSSPTIATPGGAAGAAVTGFDKTPPAAVEAFTVSPEDDGQYRLRWKRSAAADLRHYHIYFAAGGRPEISQRCRIISPGAAAAEYLDWTAPRGHASVHYAITAVDRQGNESAPAYAEL